MIDRQLLIKKWEGCKLKPYLDSVGIPTIGWGNTFYPDGRKVTMKDKPITQQQADDFLMWYCETKIKLPKGQWTMNQEIALFSLIYNIGQTAFDKSTCKKALEARNWQLAFKNWDWTKAKGRELKGLVNRRNDEKELFFEGLI